MLRNQERDRSQALEGQLTEARRQVESLQHEKTESQLELVNFLNALLSVCSISLSQGQLRMEVERKEAQLEEKREQVLQAKSKVDQITGELNEARQTISHLQSEVNSTSVSV